MKDNFSSRSRAYKKYRPEYPEEVFKFIKTHLNAFEKAWDCGTGNGQVAAKLADFIEKVDATDISENQIKYAIKKDNIRYSIQPAEKTDFESNIFDLVISAQAVHWFEFDQFFSEVKRCLKPDGIVVIMGYGLFNSNSETNKVIRNFYKNIIGPFWDPEREHLDENYKNIPFSFQEFKTPQLIQSYTWDLEHLLGYLRTWSAVKHYENAKGKDPVSLIESDLQKSFGKSNRVNFPIIFRMGKIRQN